MSVPDSASSSRRESLALASAGLFLLILTLVKSKNDLQLDEGRYLAFANNLLQGRYASEETLYLWNGPGYPLIIALVLLLKLPLLAAKILNAVFLLGTVWYFRSLLLRQEVTARATIYALALGAYLSAHGALPEFLMSECLSVFLVTAGADHAFRFFLTGGKKQAAMAAFFLGWLALTKVFFGYVLAVGLLFALAGWTLRRRSLGLKAAMVCAGALAVASPYLVYTHMLTGKAFYWGNSGGATLYCLTLPEPRFLGDWLNSDAVKEHPEFFGPHSAFYRRLDSLGFVERDVELKVAAWRNIHRHPAKVFKNWRANVNRMVFGYPVTAYPGAAPKLSTGNRSFVYALPFMLVLFTLFARRRRIRREMMILIAFLVISLAGTSLLSALPRQVFPLLPLIWAFVFVANKPAESRIQA